MAKAVIVVHLDLIYQLFEQKGLYESELVAIEEIVHQAIDEGAYYIRLSDKTDPTEVYELPVPAEDLNLEIMVVGTKNCSNLHRIALERAGYENVQLNNEGIIEHYQWK
ncbi:hypothetical protein JXC34_03430 [Candidatus Woesearchaeota archaeon]|nr:hypothetical protein [Candidatus Woesearchaeota archaeon]